MIRFWLLAIASAGGLLLAAVAALGWLSYRDLSDPDPYATTGI